MTSRREKGYVSGKTHQSLVSENFGSQAAAYLKSTVHSSGEDLDQLEELVLGQRRARVLDLGCGGGHVSYRVAPHVFEVAACDLSSRMLGAVRRAAADRGLRNIATQAGAAEALPYADRSFDFVLSRFSAHHWQDMPAGLREARRVIKRHGRAVFADSISPGRPLLDTFLQTIELLRDPSHVRNYGRIEWEQALVGAGFRPDSITERRLPLEFSSWVERMGTPESHVAAIRSLEKLVSSEIAVHFDIQADGSFTLDTIVIEASVA
jgi:ubiquinone/menaquinone biosynthesis C-methylase UbiE